MIEVKLSMEFPLPDLGAAAEVEKVLKGLVAAAAERGATNITEDTQFRRRREVPDKTSS